MRNTASKVVTTAFIFLTTFMFSVTKVSAAETILPEEIADIVDQFPGGAGLLGFITSRIRLVVAIMLIALVLFSIVYALMASFKYVRSQGDPGQIEEAQKAIKAIWMGVASLFISIIGMVLVINIFGSQLPTTIYETCIIAPQSEGCAVCEDEGDDDESNLCSFCEEEYKILAIRDDYQVDPQCEDPR